MTPNLTFHGHAACKWGPLATVPVAVLTTVILRNNIYLNCTAFGLLELCSIAIQGQCRNIPTSLFVEGTSAAEITTMSRAYINTVEPTTHLYPMAHNVKYIIMGVVKAFLLVIAVVLIACRNRHSSRPISPGFDNPLAEFELDDISYVS